MNVRETWAFLSSALGKWAKNRAIIFHKINYRANYSRSGCLGRDLSAVEKSRYGNAPAGYSMNCPFTLFRFLTPVPIQISIPPI